MVHPLTASSLAKGQYMVSWLLTGTPEQRYWQNRETANVALEVAGSSPALVNFSLFIQMYLKLYPFSFPCGLLHDIILFILTNINIAPSVDLIVECSMIFHCASQLRALYYVWWNKYRNEWWHFVMEKLHCGGLNIKDFFYKIYIFNFLWTRFGA